MNVQSVCSVLEKGSRVRISAQGTHKSPHLNGVEGVIHAMPVHPTTWFKVQFPSGEIATFRSSALIPLDANGAPIPGFGTESRGTAGASHRHESKEFSSRGGERYHGMEVETPHASGGRRVLREHSSHYLNNSYDQDMPSSRSSRPRSSSFGPGGRGFSTGFRSNMYNSTSNSRFTTNATEAERKTFNDFVELAYASAYVQECADNTHCRGVIAAKHLANEGPCAECGIRRVRAGSVAGGFCWNAYCQSSPVYGRGTKRAPGTLDSRPHSVSMSSFQSESDLSRAEGMRQGNNGEHEPTLKGAHGTNSGFYPVSPDSSSSSLTKVGSSMSLSIDGSAHGTDRSGHIVSTVSSSSSTSSFAESATTDGDLEVSMQTPGDEADGNMSMADTRTRGDFKVASAESNGSSEGGRSWSFHSADSDGTLTHSYGGFGTGPDSAFTSIKGEGSDEPIKTREVRGVTSGDQGGLSSVVSDQALSELSERNGDGTPAATTATGALPTKQPVPRLSGTHLGAAAGAGAGAGAATQSGDDNAMNVEDSPWQKRARRAE